MLTGCGLFGHKHSKPNPDVKSTQPVEKKPHDKLIVTPETMLVGKVVRVNSVARFAVLNFPIGSLPGIGRQLNAYRQGLKVGEIKITGPQQDDNTVGDIVNGEVQVGDELRGN
jgi:hypothetical protein